MAVFIWTIVYSTLPPTIGKYDSTYQAEIAPMDVGRMLAPCTSRMETSNRIRPVTDPWIAVLRAFLRSSR
jgi:hypothetical protein